MTPPSTAPQPQLAAPATNTATGLVPANLIERAKEYARASKSDGTRRTYASAWRIFSGWCEERGLSPLPASTETVVAWIADAGEHLRPVTVKKILSAVSQAHQVTEEPLPPKHSYLIRPSLKSGDGEDYCFSAPGTVGKEFPVATEVLTEMWAL